MTREPTDSSDDAATRHEKTATRYGLISFYLHAAVWGAAQQVGTDNALLLHAVGLLFCSAATYAAIEDSRRRRRPLVRSLRVVFFFTWPLAWLVYLITTRGWRGVGWWLLHAVGLYAATFLGYSVAFLLTS